MAERGWQSAGRMKCSFMVLLLAAVCGCASVQSKYAAVQTPEMKFRYQQCVDFLSAEQGRMNFRFGPPAFMMMQGDPRNDRIKEKEEIETELFRRYRAGDSAAYLPMFGGSSALGGAQSP